MLKMKLEVLEAVEVEDEGCGDGSLLRLKRKIFWLMVERMGR